jgi:uncharacterized protein
MSTLLGWLESAATRRPGWVVAGLVAVTVAMGALASTNEIEVDLTQLGSEDSEAVQAMQRVRGEFGDPAAMVQVILDAGSGGDMLTADGLTAIGMVEEVALQALGSAARTGDDGQPQVLSLRSVVGPVLAQQGRDLASADDTLVGTIAARAVQANPQIAALVSDDLDVVTGSARGTVVVLPLDPELSEAERTEAAQDVRDALDATSGDVPDDLQVSVFSNGLFVSGLLDAIRAEVPLLFGLALLVVLTILGLAYRSVFDVAIGFAGLVATVVCTFGLVALLGPSNLGWTGPLTQLAVIVPVLLVGLGIDYSVHLTARYREQRAGGQTPSAAAGRALHTVGAALVLATAATAIGFASITTAPLGMLADFGLFVAVGVVCAFVIMTLLVPAARVLRDRDDVGGQPAAVRELGLGRLLRGPARLARRAPWAGMVLAVALAATSLAVASGLEVSFDRDDFIPVGSDVAAALAHQEEVFGGGVTEATFVVVDADLTDPTIANEVWKAQLAVADIDGVRMVGGSPQVVSVLTLAAAMLDPERQPLSATPPPRDPRDPDGLPSGAMWTRDGFAEDADLEAVYDLLRRAVGEQRVAQLLTPGATAGVVQIRTTTGDAGAERVHRQVEAAFAPVEQAGGMVTVTSEPIIIAEMSEELSTFQIRAIALTLVVVLVLLSAYYAVTIRRPLLGAIAMIPATVSASLVLGSMWVLGISFNVLTATLTAIAVGIGVPYGVHVVNRFVEDREGGALDDPVATTLHSTGGALTGSALTTLGAFAVLTFSGLPPIRSLGLLGGTGIAVALLAAILVEPGALVLWSRHHDRRLRNDEAAGQEGSGPPSARLVRPR